MPSTVIRVKLVHGVESQGSKTPEDAGMETSRPHIRSICFEGDRRIPATDVYAMLQGLAGPCAGERHTCSAPAQAIQSRKHRGYFTNASPGKPNIVTVANGEIEHAMSARAYPCQKGGPVRKCGRRLHALKAGMGPSGSKTVKRWQLIGSECFDDIPICPVESDNERLGRHNAYIAWRWAKRSRPSNSTG